MNRNLYALAMGCGSLLLFLMQPMLAKGLLPRYGGSSGVWVTAMLFFQIGLLLGYLYAFLLTRFFTRWMQGVIHVGLVAMSLTLLPLHARPELAGLSPVVSILLTLLVSAGLPYFLLASTTPLLQSWFEGRRYRLFALSNLVSVLALLAYPVVIEPHLSGRAQSLGWSGLYVVFALVVGWLALQARSGDVVRLEPGHREFRPWLWAGLAACASTLWMAVANHLSQEVAPVPFLWILPLGLYLLSFVVCFEGHGWYRPAMFRALLPVAWIAVCYCIANPAAGEGLKWEIGAFSAALFVICTFCHGELEKTKPIRRSDLPSFYLMIALGGALGGMFVGVVAPGVFDSFLELPLAITASVLLALPLLYQVRSTARLVRLAAVAGATFFVATRFTSGAGIEVRNFYGALQVNENGVFRSLYNGRTLHGAEFLAPERSRVPTAYYGAESGAGQLLSRESPPRRVGLVGLGAGALASYGRPGDTFVFYEINPAVIRIAREPFRFLRESKATVEVIEADGRLALEKEKPGSFDVLILDAFSGDSIPVHLLTKEAFELYGRLLRSDGALAIHVTNRYLDLKPVVLALAASIGREAHPVHSAARPRDQVVEADWVVISGSVPPSTGANLWTDDSSNLFQVLR